MFADDTKIYRQIAWREDALILQSDIKRLEEWSKIWQLHFDKCHILTMGKFENIQHTHRYVVYDNEITYDVVSKMITERFRLFANRINKTMQ